MAKEPYSTVLAEEKHKEKVKFVNHKKEDEIVEMNIANATSTLDNIGHPRR